MGDEQIFNTLVEFFEEDDWDFQWLEGMPVLSMGFSGKNGNWTCYAQARESQQQFVFYSVLPVNAPDNRRSDVAEFITRANYGMILGNFEMDFEDGEIRYKTSIDVEGATLAPPLIRQLVYANVIITDRYLPGIMRVIYGNMTATDALESVENDLANGDVDTLDTEDDGHTDMDSTTFVDDFDDDDPFYYLDDDDDDDDLDDDVLDDDELDDDFDDSEPSANGKSPH